MMKAKYINADGRTVVLLGLSHKNLDRLREQGLKGFIEINGEDLEISHDIYITAARDEREMLEAMQDSIGEATRLRLPEDMKS